MDIGGANIKAATADGHSRLVPFPIWRQPDQLQSRLQQLATAELSQPDMVALTMTAELADCFATKAAGVQFVIEAVQAAFPQCPVRVWLTSGEFVEAADAIDLPMLAAASNWHVLATWAGRAVPSGPALLIDTGSTTTDIIPLLDGRPATEGLTDLGRLQHHELVYTGATRTPVCAIVRTLPVDGHAVPVAAELFAATRDVYLLTGDLAEQPDCCDTADGRPATRSCAASRLAHMVCCDATELSAAQVQQLAAAVAEQQTAQLAAAIRNRLAYVRQLSRAEGAGHRPPTILLSGSGYFLAARAVAQVSLPEPAEILNLSQMFGGRVAESACAFAAARLCADRCLDDLLPLQPF